MPNFKTRLDDFLLASQVMIENALADAEIKEKVAAFGYSENKLVQAKTLYQEVTELYNKQKKEYGEQIEATKEQKYAYDETNKAYMKSLKVARVAFQNNAKAASLLIDGQRKQSLSGYVEQANAFYTNLLNDPELLGIMAEFGCTIEKLKAEHELVRKLIVKVEAHAKETGEAQTATEKRDKKIDELDSWLSDFKKIVKVAFEDDRQKLEKLGITAKS